MKYLKTILIVVVVIGAIATAKFVFFPSGQAKGSGFAMGGKTPSSPVTIYVAKTSNLDNKLLATGTVLANEATALMPEVSGRIIFLYMPEGQSVAQGTLLVKINDNDLKAQLNKVMSQMKLASESEIRQRRMLQIEGTSQQEYDLALSTLGSLKADSAFYQAQIAKTEIRAPFNGSVGIRNVSPGSNVSPTTIVTTIQQTNPVKIDFFLPEKYTALLKVGETISFRTESNPNAFQAKISVRDPNIDVTSRNVRYRAIAQNPKGELLPGSFVHIELILRDNKGSIYIPTEAIVPTIKGKKVFVVKNNIAEERMVTDGLRTSDKIQIYKGLEIGDSVVLAGNTQLKAGAPVKVVK